MNLFDVGSAAVIGDAEIADRASAQCRQRRDSLQRFRPGNVGISNLQYLVGVARQRSRDRDRAREPYRTEPSAGNEVYVSHLEFSLFKGRIRSWSSDEPSSCGSAAESGSRTSRSSLRESS